MFFLLFCVILVWSQKVSVVRWSLGINRNEVKAGAIVRSKEKSSRQRKDVAKIISAFQLGAYLSEIQQLLARSTGVWKSLD